MTLGNTTVSLLPGFLQKSPHSHLDSTTLLSLTAFLTFVTILTFFSIRVPLTLTEMPSSPSSLPHFHYSFSINFLTLPLHPLHPCLRALGPALSTLRVLSRPPHRPSSLGTYRKVHLRLWDLGTHGTVRASSRLPPGRAGHTHGHRQRWCHRNRCSPQWTHRSKCHKCRRRGMAQGPPTKKEPHMAPT